MCIHLPLYSTYLQTIIYLGAARHRVFFLIKLKIKISGKPILNSQISLEWWSTNILGHRGRVFHQNEVKITPVTRHRHLSSVNG